MVEKKSYKLIALLGAIGVYVLVLSLVYQYIVDEERKKKDFGFNVEEAVVVDIDQLMPKPSPAPLKTPPKKVIPTPKLPTPKPKVVQKISKPQPKSIPPSSKEKIIESLKDVEKEVAKEAKESRDKVAKSAKDLFSTVRTDKYEKAMRERQKQEEARASRLKKQRAEAARKKEEARRRRKALEAKRRAERQQRAQKLLQELQLTQSSKKHRKKGEEDPFWSFVSNKIMGKWNRTVATQDGLSGHATIRIDNQGRLTYRNLKLSGNNLFDTKLKVFLDNLEYERFPAYKDGPYIEAVFEFKDKEKGL